MRKRLTGLLVIAVLAIGALVISPALVFAHDGEDHESTVSGEKDEQTRQQQKEVRQQELREKAEAAKEKRLDAAKLKICKERETRIKAIMNRGTVRAEKQLELFNTITTRTKAFYESKGKTLANYDELLAIADAAKATAEASLTTLKATPRFACEDGDPKGNAGAHQTAAKQLTEDLKAYRAAVKNLIVGVKSVQGANDEQ